MCTGASMPEFSFGCPALACRQCGCRMLTRVGRTKPMLICTDCGLPVDQRETATATRQQLGGAVTLMAMALLGGAMLLLASINEAQRAGLLEGGSEERRDDAKEGTDAKAQNLLEPSSLVDLYGSRRSEQSREPAASPPARRKDVR